MQAVFRDVAPGQGLAALRAGGDLPGGREAGQVRPLPARVQEHEVVPGREVVPEQALELALLPGDAGAREPQVRPAR